MNIHEFLEKRGMSLGYNYLEKIAFEKLAVFGRSKSTLTSTIGKAESGDLFGASQDLITNKKSRQRALEIANKMKREGKFDSEAMQGIKPHIPEKMPGLMELPGRAKNALGFLQTARKNPAFRSELKNILGDVRQRAAA
jgi:hypothetical protein